MKTRSGFVSNSSSSSFTVAAKGKVSKERIVELLGVPKESPLYGFAEDIASLLMPNNYGGKQFDSLLDYLDYLVLDQGYETIRAKEYFAKEIELLQNGFTIWTGTVSDDSWDNKAEVWLCDNTLNYESEDLVIMHDGGY